jgi:hypothetical protein
MCRYTYYLPITVVARSNEINVFACLNAGIVGSDPTKGMYVCVCVYSVCRTGLATDWSSVQGFLPTMKTLRNWIRGQGRTNGCRATDELKITNYLLERVEAVSNQIPQYHLHVTHEMFFWSRFDVESVIHARICVIKSRIISNFAWFINIGLIYFLCRGLCLDIGPRSFNDIFTSSSYMWFTSIIFCYFLVNLKGRIFENRRSICSSSSLPILRSYRRFLLHRQHDTVSYAFAFIHSDTIRLGRGQIYFDSLKIQKFCKFAIKL